MNNEYSTELNKIEAALQKTLPLSTSSSWWQDAFPGLPLKPDFTEALLEPAQDLFNRGGKRWRPLLGHLVCRTLGGGDAALPLLPLVEFPHNASLIHDDIEDNSTERRGKPAIHLLYGNDTAINSGAFLYFLPLMVLEHWNADPQAQIRVWKLWAAHMRMLHLGQSMDIAWHREPAYIPCINDYLFMCGQKTGCLARFAALLGAEVASARNSAQLPENLTRALGEAAQKLGIGFQILDDVKNLSTGIPGKKRGDDVVEGKKSLPVLYYLYGVNNKMNSNMVNSDRVNSTLGHSNEEQQRRSLFVQRCFNAAKTAAGDGTDWTSVPLVEELIEALEKAGALAQAEYQGKTLIREAGEFFSGIDLQIDNSEEAAQARKLLAGLAEQLM